MERPLPADSYTASSGFRVVLYFSHWPQLLQTNGCARICVRVCARARGVFQSSVGVWEQRQPAAFVGHRPEIDTHLPLRSPGPPSTDETVQLFIRDLRKCARNSLNPGIYIQYLDPPPRPLDLTALHRTGRLQPKQRWTARGVPRRRDSPERSLQRPENSFCRGHIWKQKRQDGSRKHTRSPDSAPAVARASHLRWWRERRERKRRKRERCTKYSL